MKLGLAVHISNEEKRTLQETEECLAAIRFMAQIQKRPVSLFMMMRSIFLAPYGSVPKNKKKTPSIKKKQKNISFAPSPEK
ncbi:hypothetical protein BsIDN1_34660 [Bacillus safensis]|uniref:Uncharacterized protein n=1 Tax=Bacillus safensis TaxID=561879 RepID=A0A5S9MAC1_BACIA|nr:hypothetical protein BsIDN1_34660 [Bacillus safensis]